MGGGSFIDGTMLVLYDRCESLNNERQTILLVWVEKLVFISSPHIFYWIY